MPELKDMNEKISKTRVALDEEYYLLGKTIFESTDKANNKISALIDKLIEYRIKLHDMKQVISCSECGEENDSNSKFCQNCGHKIGNEE